MPTLSNFFVKLTLRLFASLKPSAISRNKKRIRQKGFVLPVAILIVLLLSLVTVGLLSRSTVRNQQTTIERAVQLTNRQLNSAVDRARAKITRLLRDPSLPLSAPSDLNFQDVLFTPTYDLPDENTFVLTSTFNPNVQTKGWWFNVDTDGDGNDDAVSAYMFVWYRSIVDDIDPTDERRFENLGNNDLDRANFLLTRSGPLQRSVGAQEGCFDNTAAAADPGAWFRVGPSQYKPIQAYAVTVPATGATGSTRALAALQYQQDGRRNFLNKFAAFSRSDMEFFRTPPLSLNGAIYTGGSIFLNPEGVGAGRALYAHLISSPSSCFYMPPEESQITAFHDFAVGDIGTGQWWADITSNYRIFVHPQQAGLAPAAGNPIAITRNADSVNEVGVTPVDVAIDPLRLVVFDEYQQRNYGTGANQNPLDAPGWPDSELNVNNTFDDPNRPGRILAGGGDNTANAEDLENSTLFCPPYVDDVFRADNRFGPKPSYNRPPQIPRADEDFDGNGEPDGCRVSDFRDLINAQGDARNVVNGDPIANAALINGIGIVNDGSSPVEEQRNRPSPDTGELLINAQAGDVVGGLLDSDGDPLQPDSAPDEFGLDGYWERRATYQGMKVVVGQRLELTRTDSLPTVLVPGNLDLPLNQIGADRLQPTLISNMARQRQTLRDNLAAIQATAIYHYSVNDGSFPIACLATTAHPGTPESLRNASTIPINDPEQINFFTGQGTNSWEFTPPARNEAEFAGFINDINSPLNRMLDNLAHFAGDPEGAYPPVQEAGAIHPDPVMSAFGNFSELLSIMERVNDPVTPIPYRQLSLAEKTTLHTAACTVGMLADNIERLAAADPIREDIDAIRNGDINQDGDWLNDPTDPGTRSDRDRNFYAPLRYVFPSDIPLGEPSFQEVSTNTFDAIAIAPTVLNGDLKIDGTDVIYRSERLDALVAPVRGDVEPSYQFRAVNPGDFVNGDGDRAVRPRPLTGPNSWQLPFQTLDCTTTTPTQSLGRVLSNQLSLVRQGDAGQCVRVPFKDVAFYDGRESLAVRALDMDLALLTNNVAGATNSLVNGDSWLPSGVVNDLIEGGILYGFREDAVREDDVARPALQTWGNYLTEWERNALPNKRAADIKGCGGENFIMNPGQPRADSNGTACLSSVGDNDLERARRNSPIGDPPLSEPLRISSKAIDYYPDPDRRPFGFRLNNGAVLRRDGGADLDQGGFGLSFISDNTVYIKGDFNLHQDAGGNLLEEFETGFDGDTNFFASNFYTRNDQDLDFARVATDLWRPSDVLGDSVNVLSGNFCDGSIQDGFVQDGAFNGGGSNFNRNNSPDRRVYGCNDSPNENRATSFANQTMASRAGWPSQNIANYGNATTGIRGTGIAGAINPDGAAYGNQLFFGRDILANGRDLQLTDQEQPNRGSNPIRVSAEGNPVADTTTWQLVAPFPAECPPPGSPGSPFTVAGSGLLGEYFSGYGADNMQTKNTTTLVGTSDIPQDMPDGNRVVVRTEQVWWTGNTGTQCVGGGTNDLRMTNSGWPWASGNPVATRFQNFLTLVPGISPTSGRTFETPPAGVAPDRFLGRWRGYMAARFAGVVNYRINTDDGGRLWIGQPLNFPAATPSSINPTTQNPYDLSAPGVNRTITDVEKRRIPRDEGSFTQNWTNGGNVQTNANPLLIPSCATLIPIEINMYEQGGGQRAELRVQSQVSGVTRNLGLETAFLFPLPPSTNPPTSFVAVTSDYNPLGFPGCVAAPPPPPPPPGPPTPPPPPPTPPPTPPPPPPTGGGGDDASLPTYMRPQSPLSQEESLQARLGEDSQNQESTLVAKTANGQQDLDWSRLLSAPIDWLFGSAAHAAEYGLEFSPPGTLDLQINDAGLAPGIRVAVAPPGTLSGNLAFLPDCGGDDGRGSYGFLGNGRWVPGVFRPNYNSTFRYIPYTGLPFVVQGRRVGSAGFNGLPSTRTDPLFSGFLDDPAQPGSARTTYLNDPNGAIDADRFDTPPDPLLLSTRLNPFNPFLRHNARDLGYVADQLNLDTGTFPNAKANAGDIDNGLCFYVEVRNRQPQIQVDNNGPGSGGRGWRTIEAVFADNTAQAVNNNATNPIRAIVLDEITRRPIPVPDYQPLNSLAGNARKRDGTDPSDNRQLQRATPTRVNALASGGLTPPRDQDTSGGFQNFLRMNESWTNTRLFFSGSMIQLNFSSTATAPFSQSRFEAPYDRNLGLESNFDYFSPPTRVFGYDVGFLFASRTSPVASRFERPSNLRTESVSDLQPNDPYVVRLRCALKDSGAPVDDPLNCP